MTSSSCHYHLPFNSSSISTPPRPPSATQTPPSSSLSFHSDPLFPSLTCKPTSHLHARHDPCAPSASASSSLLDRALLDEGDRVGSELGPAALAAAFPSLAHANVLWFKSGYYNVQVVVREDEPEESLLRRFKREVMRAGVIQESRRRRFFEDAQDRKKRKSR